MKVTGETIARTVCLTLALVNQCLAIFGKEKLPFAEDEMYQLTTLLFTIITAGIAWWKNNSFTQNAMKADEYLKELKEADIDE